MSTLLRLDPQSLPSSIVWPTSLSDEEFEVLCLNNDLFQFERTHEGEIRMNPPAGGFTGDGNAEIISQLRVWWTKHGIGRTFDSNTGFLLPDSSILCPDAAYVSPDKLKGLTRENFSGFPRLCPDFVIELLSKSDRLHTTEGKMMLWLQNGAALGWLIDPYEQKVLVYQPGREPVAVTGSAVEGVGPVVGFTLDLGKVWRCYEF